MDELVGKTIARVADDCDSRSLFFTDGTSVVVTGEDYLRVEVRDAVETRRAAAVAQGKREVERLQRLRREEWLSVSCEERVRRKAVAEERYERWCATASPELRALSSMRREMTANLFRQDYTLMMAFWDRRPRLTACEACGELQCPNAAWVRR